MANLIPQGGVFSGIDRLNQALDQRYQNALALSQMQEARRRNALIEGYAAEDRDRQMKGIERQESIRNAMAQPYTQQTGGPLMAQQGQNYQPISLQTMQPTRELVGQRLQGLGEWEQALKLMPEPVKPENYTLTPGALRFGPDNQVVASAPTAPRPVDYEPFGYGQVINKQDGTVTRVPVPPQSSMVGGLPKPPSGYRYTANNELEAIPGGPAAQKQLANAQTLADGAAAVDYTSDSIDRLLNHPGRQAATGLSSKLDPRNYTPGTDAYNFNAELESFDAKLFLSNIQQMKGMGALSNAEGAKVSAAAGAIKPGMSEKAFVDNLTIIKNELAKAKARKDSGALLPVNGQQEPADKKSQNLQSLSDADILKALGGK